MQITEFEIADCWSEEEIMIYRDKLQREIEIFNKAMELKIQRLEKLTLDNNLYKKL